MTARLVAGEVIDPPAAPPTRLRYLEEAPPKPTAAQWALAVLAVCAVRLFGYVLAAALVLGLTVAACSAMLAPSGPAGPTYQPATLPPWPTMAPDSPAPAVPHVTDDPRATFADPVYDCADADPNDPEIAPTYDCEEAQP